MNIHTFRVMTHGQKPPQGYELLGWIPNHPTSKRHSTAMGVLRSLAGIAVAWDGQATVSLPNDWQSKVAFVSAKETPGATRKNITQPTDWWVAFEACAKQQGKNLSEWVGEQCLAGLEKRKASKLSERSGTGPKPKADDDSKC